jgi:semaphorin 5
MDSVLLSFHGQFKRQKDTHSIWESASVSNRDTFECTANTINSSEPHHSELLNSQYQLMDSAVQPVNGRPYIIHTEKQFQFIAVDVIQSKYHNSVEIIFVTTKDGLLLKYVQWPFSTQACLIDTIQIIDSSANETGDYNSDPNGDAILSMKLLKDTQSIYLGTKKEIIRIDVQRCKQYSTRDECVESGDPYCGWNTMQMSCGTAPSRNPHSIHWLQSNSTLCPNSLQLMDEWSDWFDCNQLNDTYGDRCLCRTKPCDSLSRNKCSANGYEVQLTNCTVHGKWSEWSQWAVCTASCGVASKYRHRTCSSPAPAFGGRQCDGDSKEVNFD